MFVFGLITGLRVIALIVVSSLIWVPIGVWVGLRLRLVQRVQPIVQFLAAFPANLLFPIVVVMIVRFNLNVDVWVSPLMVFGTQWYILFNVIASASAVPAELRYAASNFGVGGGLWWRRVMLPAIFPAYLTGAVTAAGGSWNASIEAELVKWGGTTLTATGIGAYIAHWTDVGDFPRITLGVSVLALYVVVLNRLLWRPLYNHAAERMRLDRKRRRDADEFKPDLMTLNEVSKAYAVADHEGRLVLDRIHLRLAESEIVAVLGKSGCGKSTLLRLMAGLIAPSAGEVLYRGQPIRGPARGIAMVFQTFALFPWLTVLQNVELGLEAQGVPRAKRRERALKAIDVIGLDGFESAYPKELSGGMRQRVGFARALVVNPDLLLLDQPFSALDVLTAETLRGDVLELWQENQIRTRGIVLVSHNIEEAVGMADRIVVLSSDPGRVHADIPVALPHPRNSESPPFRQTVDEVYTLLTTPFADRAQRRKARPEPSGIGFRLLPAPVQQLTGLIDALQDQPYAGRADVPDLADALELQVDGLLPLIETLQLLGFAHVRDGDIEMTPAGRAFSQGDIQARKRIFAEHLVRHIPLASHMVRILGERANHTASSDRFRTELEDHLSAEEARRVMKTIINWGRYAEIFAYDYHSGVLSLENPLTSAERTTVLPRSSRSLLILVGCAFFCPATVRRGLLGGGETSRKRRATKVNAWPSSR